MGGWQMDGFMGQAHVTYGGKCVDREEEQSRRAQAILSLSAPPLSLPSSFVSVETDARDEVGLWVCMWAYIAGSARSSSDIFISTFL